jgi:hypothetical protein
MTSKSNYLRGSNGCLFSVGDSFGTLSLLWRRKPYAKEQPMQGSSISKFFRRWSNRRRSRNCDCSIAPGWIPTWGRFSCVSDFLVCLQTDSVWQWSLRLTKFSCNLLICDLCEELSLLRTATFSLSLWSVQQDFYDVHRADPTESYCHQLDAKRFIFVAIEHWRQN